MQSPFYQALAYPNSVSSGTFRYQLKASLKKDAKIVSSSKFPGSAVILSKQVACTPEFYDGKSNKNTNNQKNSKFILPGKLSVPELFDVLLECDRLAVSHSDVPVK